MYDIAELRHRTPIHAEGHPCITLTDPLTGKIKEKIEGKNQVFLDAVLCRPLTATGDWIDAMSTVWTCLNDSTLAVDANIPYLMGQTVGCGVPSTAGAGTCRGAYNAANQVLAQKSRESIYWKFQYDFTTAQANGTIGTIGLTHQYQRGIPYKPVSGFPVAYDSTHGRSCTSDGRYTYSCVDAGIITKYDILLGTSATIDVSVVVGTTGSTYKTVGYATDTGKYYIYVYNSTPANRRMYVFSDNTFSTLVTTYSPSNVAPPSYTLTNAMYIYGNTVVWFDAGTLNKVYYADFVNNIACTTLTINTYNNAAYSYDTYCMNGYFGVAACPLNDKYIITGMQTPDGSYSKGIIFDLSTCSVIGIIGSPITTTYNSAVCKYPLATASLPFANSGNTSVGTTFAVAAKKLDTPVVKTSANGMTVTYELEVFW